MQQYRPPVFPFQRREKIGILGGGQLGRMLAEAAHNLGLQTVVYCQNLQEPAAQIVTQVFIGSWEDEAAIEQFATSGIRWVVGEWENIPLSVVKQIAGSVQVYTMADVLRIGRNRKEEKKLAKKLGIPIGRHFFFDTSELKKTSLKDPGWGTSIIVKARHGGYDGKDQWLFETFAQFLEHDWESEKVKQFIVEERVDLDYELSVLVERDATGNVRLSPTVRNRHTSKHGGGMLEHTLWYSGVIPEEVEREAQEYARYIAVETKLVGVICVEFFFT